MWDIVAEFFGGIGDFATDVATEIGGALTSFGDWAESLFSDSVSMDESVLAATDDVAATDAGGVSSLTVDAADTESAAEKIADTGISTDPWESSVAESANQNAALAKGALAEKKKGLLDSFMDWYKDLDKDEKTLFKGVAGAGLAGLATMGAEALKGNNREDEIRLQAELAGQTAHDRRAGELAATQAANRVPIGAPFKPKAGAQLRNRAGQVIALPNNPMVQRSGIINGGIYGR